MKVLLINPPYPFEESPTPPFGLMSLAAYLIEKGIEVRIADFIITRFSEDKARAIIDDFNPDVIGATGVTMNIKKAFSILQFFKELKPEAVFVMGGPHVTFDADTVLRENSFLDYIVRGEGEVTCTELLRAIQNNTSPEGILGISYRNGNEIIHNDRRPFIEDINTLPFPARHLVSLTKYRALRFPINMVTSRGCPHQCIFCLGSKMVGRKVRYFDTMRIVDEFEMLSKMGFSQINIVDDLFTSNKKRCIEFCDEIMRRGIQHKWTAFARVDTVSLELLQAMQKAGCTTLCFGIESGNQEILDTVKKRITIEKCIRAVDLCRKAGIIPMTSYILGLPGETRKTVQMTMDFAKKLSPHYGYHILAPFPGTEVREQKENYGITILTDDWDLYDANQAVCITDNISADEINEIAREFNSLTAKKIRDIEARLKSGGEVSAEEHGLFNNLKGFIISIDIIHNELIEAFPGIQNGADMESFVKHVVSHLKSSLTYDEMDIAEQVRILLDNQCLSVNSSSGTTTIAWN
ncbi:MAG TPA: radical SAM protein [Spirochaetota bacterium]|nr:radical SAM protein [Spirochaetota bacterium]